MFKYSKINISLLLKTTLPASALVAAEFLHDINVSLIILTIPVIAIITFYIVRTFRFLQILYIFAMLSFLIISLEFSLRHVGPDNSITLSSSKSWINGVRGNNTLVCYPSNPDGNFKINLRENRYKQYFGVSDDTIGDNPFCVYEERNSHGYRDKEATNSVSKIPVAFLGDSFVVGEGVDTEDRFTNMLATKPTWQQKYEVYNLGISGADIDEIYKKEFTYALEHGAKYIVYCYNLNDSFISTEMKNKQKYINDLMNTKNENLWIFNFIESRLQRAENSPIKFFIFNTELNILSSSRLIYVIRKIIFDRIITNETIEWYRDIYSEKNSEWDRTKNILVKMNAEAEAKNVGFCVVLMPIFYDFSRYPFHKAHKTILDFLSAKKIAAMDTLPSFKDSVARNCIVHPLDYHPNKHGHMLLANAMNDYVDHSITNHIDHRVKY